MSSKHIQTNNKSQRTGVTLVEILIVVAILLIVAAFIFPTFQGAKQSSKRTVTKSRLNQIYKALIMYGGDYDVFDEAPGLGSVPAFPLELVTVLAPYGVEGEILHSAVFPEAGKKRWPTSFTYNWVTRLRSDPNSPPQPNDQAGRNRLRLAEEQSSYVIIQDLVHDYYEFWPGEKESDPFMQRRYEINLRVDGSVKSERRSGIRGWMLKF